MPSVDEEAKDSGANNDMLDRLSEAILSNLMVFDTVGISRDKVKQLLAYDGVSLVGGGIELQTPISPKLSEDTGRKLFARYSALLEDYDSGRISSNKLSRIREDNGFERKVAAVQQSKSKFN